MSTSTLVPAVRERRAGRVLVVVADGGEVRESAVPGWVAGWCRRSGWELRRHPEAGPVAAAAAARLDTRVLVLRPSAAAESAQRGPGPRVVAALRSLPDDGPVVADAAECAARIGATLTLVHAVPRSFGERSVGLDGAVAHGRRLLDAAAGQVSAREPGLPVDCHLLRVRPHELVGEALDADLLVVGGPRREHPGPPAAGVLRSGGPGLVAHSALHHAPCPVLLTPR